MGQTTWHFANTTSSSPSATLYETVYASEATASHKNTVDNTSYHEISTKTSGHLLVETEAQEATVGPKVYTTYTSSTSKHYDMTSTVAGDTARYINQVHNALESLVYMLVPNRTTYSDITTVDASWYSLSTNSSTALGSGTSTSKLTSPTPASVDQPVQEVSQFDLIFLNATSPCYIALDHSNNSFIMIWQAPISTRSTPTDPNALSDAKKANSLTSIFYYWAKVVLYSVLGVFALFKATKVIVDKVQQLRAWLARRRAL